MDYMGVLKEAWGVTWRNRSLWILGLFAGGGASLSTSNWSTPESGGSQAWQTPTGTPTEQLQRGLDEAGHALGTSLGTAAEWWALIAVVIFALIVIGLVFWAIGVAARGGLIEQTREAIAGRSTSAMAGWRTGFRYWGRVFAVSFLLGLPLLALGILGTIVFLMFGGLALVGGSVQFTAGLVGMGALLSLIGIVAIGVGVLIGMLEEVALRHAILDDHPAIESIKAAWDDLWQRRGVASMWLVMIVVNIVAGIIGALLFIPVAIAVAAVVASAVLTAGASLLVLMAPLIVLVSCIGFVYKAVYSTFRNSAWTSFYARIERPEPVAA